MLSYFHFRKHYRDFTELAKTLFRNRSLVWEMSRREIYDRYTGQVFGILWSVGHPLILMGIYVFVFTFIFQMRFGGTYEMPLNYPTFLLSGLIPWMTIQETMMKSCTAVISQSNMVKQVIFPVEILPVKIVLSSMFTQIVSSAILIVYVILTNRFIPWTYIVLPVLFVIQILFMTGLSFLFSSIGVYFRDLKDFIFVFCTAGLYILPIIYIPSMLEMIPVYLKPILYLNPISYLIWCYQDLCYFGRFEHPFAWIVCVSMALGALFIGYKIFNKLKVMFGNFL